MNPTALRIAGILGFLGVAAGTFGAHGLDSILPAAVTAVTADPALLAERYEWFDTAVRYHLLHAIAALAVTALLPAPSRPLRIALALFVAGILLFSGSLYALALTGWRPLGMVTPFGGLALMAGWLCLIPAARATSDRRTL